MISKTVLVYVPGWPLRWETFLPKAHLARLAAREIALGRDAEVFDFGTPSSLERFTEDLAAHAEQVARSGGAGRLGWFRTRNTRGRLLAACGKWHRDLAAQVAESHAGKIIYLADTRDEYRESRAVAAIVAGLKPGAVQTVCGLHAEGYVPYVAGVGSVFEGGGAGRCTGFRGAPAGIRPLRLPIPLFRRKTAPVRHVRERPARGGRN